MMEHVSSPADAMPTLYHAVLDLTHELDHQGGHAEAARLRAQAIAAYSMAWDPRQRRRLERIELRLRRSIKAQSAGPA